MAAMCVPVAANAQLGGLVNKAKKKAEQVVDKKKDEAKKEAKKAKDDAKMQAVDTQRPPLPWTMSEKGQYNGMNVEEFLTNISDVPEEELKTLREQMDARYKSNWQIEKVISDYSLKQSIKKENERWWDFYGQIQHITNLGLQNVQISESGAINKDHATYFITGRGGGVRGINVELRDGKFRFCTLGHDATYLNDEEMNSAIDAAKRMRQFQIFTRGIHLLWDEIGEKYDLKDRYMYNFEGIYAMAVEEALESNKPENIEYHAIPKAGALHAKFKAEALAIAKSQNPKVIDVVITSSDWDVKMKGLVPDHRSIYGYVITQDEHGKICSSRAWTQSYQGNGNYGKLRAGGVGVTSDFYVK